MSVMIATMLKVRDEESAGGWVGGRASERHGGTHSSALFS